MANIYFDEVNPFWVIRNLTDSIDCFFSSFFFQVFVFISIEEFVRDLFFDFILLSSCIWKRPQKWFFRWLSLFSFVQWNANFHMYNTCIQCILYTWASEQQSFNRIWMQYYSQSNKIFYSKHSDSIRLLMYWIKL